MGLDITSTFRNDKIALGTMIIYYWFSGSNSVDKNSKDCLVFNGEIYGYKDSAKQLQDAGIELNDSRTLKYLNYWLIWHWKRHWQNWWYVRFCLFLF